MRASASHSPPKLARAVLPTTLFFDSRFPGGGCSFAAPPQKPRLFFPAPHRFCFFAFVLLPSLKAPRVSISLSLVSRVATAPLLGSGPKPLFPPPVFSPLRHAAAVNRSRTRAPGPPRREKANKKKQRRKHARDGAPTGQPPPLFFLLVQNLKMHTTPTGEKTRSADSAAREKFQFPKPKRLLFALSLSLFRFRPAPLKLCKKTKTHKPIVMLYTRARTSFFTSRPLAPRCCHLPCAAAAPSATRAP